MIWYLAHLLTAKSERWMVQGSLLPWALRGLSSSFCLFCVSNTAGGFFPSSQQTETLTSLSNKQCGSYSGFTEGQASISLFSAISSRQENLHSSSLILRPVQENIFQRLQPRAFWELGSPPAHSFQAENLDPTSCFPVCYNSRIKHAT